MLKDGRRLVALLPMKANSDRIPGKNFRQFAGKPLFQWILGKLQSMPEVDRIVINTDARRILQERGVVESERLTIRDRAQAICGDDTSMNLIIQDDVCNVEADVYLMTHTTNPLVKVSTILAALNIFLEDLDRKRFDSLFAVRRFQSRFYRLDGSPINHNPEKLVRTQDLEPWYEENSNLYIFTAESFSVSKSRIGIRPRLFEISKLESVDIDDEEDWRIAEALALSQTREG